MTTSSIFQFSNIQFILSRFSISKFNNIVINLLSYYISRIFRKHIVWGKPFAITVEPTGLCNLECPECPVGAATLTRPQLNLDLNKFKNVVDEISKHALILQLYFQGEPFINKSIIDMIDYSDKNGLFSVISTNGLNLDRPGFANSIANSNLGRLIISVDGATDKTYQVYRKSGDFDKLIKGIKLICDEKKRLKKLFPIIDLQFIVMKQNEGEISKIKNLGKKLGVDRVIYKSPQIYNFNNADNFLPSIEKFRRYRKVDSEYKLKGSYSGYCQKLWIGSVITADQQVLPCCFDKDANHSFGELNSGTFQNIWDSKNYHRFRANVISNRSQIDICKNCSEGLKIFQRS